VRRSFALLLAAMLAGCPTTPPPCANATLPDCSGTVAPDFATLQATVLAPRCVVMSACHSFEEHEGDVILAAPDEAYETLSPYVIPGDATCSALAFRVTTSAPLLRMPPAGGLSAADRCAIVSWIEAGARR
jgi:hypothetical protein